MIRHACRALLAVLLCLIFPGCLGYHLGASKPTFMQGVKVIAVPTVRNETLVPRIEVLTTDAIVRQIQLDGVYKVTDSLDNADAVLECEIRNITRIPTEAVLGNVLQTEEFTMQMLVHYRVVRRATGEPVDDRVTQGLAVFFVSGDVNQDERQAIPLAAQNVAQHIATEISEGF